ncbi:hypothetical protein Anapl_04292 [Anas platyrhynchos]|uniref:Uncharacterized protein n=1 Tax=Anas platyrhynchos TaxID=8839 RepID=R0JH40_ANAPL|nr:hypothetical protein Anapl_04292 [Anas platyrhynchos]
MKVHQNLSSIHTACCLHADVSWRSAEGFSKQSDLLLLCKSRAVRTHQTVRFSKSGGRSNNEKCVEIRDEDTDEKSLVPPSNKSKSITGKQGRAGGMKMLSSSRTARIRQATLSWTQQGGLTPPGLPGQMGSDHCEEPIAIKEEIKIFSGNNLVRIISGKQADEVQKNKKHRMTAFSSKDKMEKNHQNPSFKQKPQLLPLSSLETGLPARCEELTGSAVWRDTYKRSCLFTLKHYSTKCPENGWKRKPAGDRSVLRQSLKDALPTSELSMESQLLLIQRRNTSRIMKDANMREEPLVGNHSGLNTALAALSSQHGAAAWLQQPPGTQPLQNTQNNSTIIKGLVTEPNAPSKQHRQLHHSGKEGGVCQEAQLLCKKQRAARAETLTLKIICPKNEMEAWFKLLHTSSKKPDSQWRTARAALLAATEAAAVAAGSPWDQSTRNKPSTATGYLQRCPSLSQQKGLTTQAHKENPELAAAGGKIKGVLSDISCDSTARPGCRSSPSAFEMDQRLLVLLALLIVPQQVLTNAPTAKPFILHRQQHASG